MILSHSVNNNAASATSFSTMNDTQGGINQICYDGAAPTLLNLLLLPAIKQLGQQAKWMLWLTSENKIDRSWLESSGIFIDQISTGSFTQPCTENRVANTGDQISKL